MPASLFENWFPKYVGLGYSPLARFENSWPVAWSDYCQVKAPIKLMKRWAARPDAMIALACGYTPPNGVGKLVAIDADTDEQPILDATLDTLPGCRIARFGSKGFALLTRYVGPGDGRFTHIYCGVGTQKRPLIEIKGVGQNITVPPSIHHKTGNPYFWMNPETGDKPGVFDGAAPSFSELPAVDDTDIDLLRQVMIEGGWATPPRSVPKARPDFDPKKIPESRYEAWYRAGLSNAQRALSGLGEGGGRPTMLFRSVCALGLAVHRGFIPKLEFEAAFLDACDVNGLSNREGRHAILATIDSGLRLAIDDELPDLDTEKSAVRKPAKTKRKTNGSGGTGGETSCHDLEHDHGQSQGNGYDHEANVSEGLRSDTRPIIKVHGGSLSQNASEAELILFEAKAPIYHQGGVLVKPTRCSLVDNIGDKVHVPAISRISSVGIRDEIGKYARWQKHDRRSNKWVEIDPKVEVAQIIHDRKGDGPNWRVLAGVTSSPMMRHDATIAMNPGYDDDSGWYLQDLPPMPPMPPHPDEGDARAALKVLARLLDEFPFIDSDHSDRKTKDTASYSVAMSALLTIPARPMMNVAPGHAARASEAGTGKTYLFNIASAIGLGTRCPIITQGDDRAETEKRLGALMITGSQILCIDNVNGDLQSDLLGQIISEDEINARVLGQSKTAKLTNRFVVFVTGNNLNIIADLNRRMLICEMDAVLEHPETRQFEFNPVTEVLNDRGKYIAACLTIIRAHALASYPGFAELTPLNSFEKWSRTVRGALVWLGLRDPVESMQVLKKADPHRIEQSGFVSTFAELFEPDFAPHVTVSEIIEEANKSFDDGKGGARKRMKEILREYGDRHGIVSSRRVGKWLARILGRRFGDLRLRGTNENKPMMEYWVERLP
jgi:putative DNA primase/helicase